MFLQLTQRNKDFVNAVHLEMYAGEKGLRIEDAVARAIMRPAPSYYVDFTTIERMIPLMMKRPRKVRTSPLRQLMWEEIFDKARSLRRRESHLTERQALARVVTSQSASRFFISVNTGLDIYREEMRCRSREWAQIARRV